MKYKIKVVTTKALGGRPSHVVSKSTYTTIEWEDIEVVTENIDKIRKEYDVYLDNRAVGVPDDIILKADGGSEVKADYFWLSPYIRQVKFFIENSDGDLIEGQKLKSLIKDQKRKRNEYEFVIEYIDKYIIHSEGCLNSAFIMRDWMKTPEHLKASNSDSNIRANREYIVQLAHAIADWHVLRFFCEHRRLIGRDNLECIIDNTILGVIRGINSLIDDSQARILDYQSPSPKQGRIVLRNGEKTEVDFSAITPKETFDSWIKEQEEAIKRYFIHKDEATRALYIVNQLPVNDR